MSTCTTAPPVRQPRQPRVKPRRTLRLLRRLDPDGAGGLLRLRIGDEPVNVYALRRLASDFGQAFELAKLAMVQSPQGGFEPAVAERYAVNLDFASSLCHCKGFEKWGHCKHIESLLKLQDLGLI
jgi:hypothetical protein